MIPSPRPLGELFVRGRRQQGSLIRPRNTADWQSSWSRHHIITTKEIVKYRYNGSLDKCNADQCLKLLRPLRLPTFCPRAQVRRMQRSRRVAKMVLPASLQRRSTELRGLLAAAGGGEFPACTAKSDAEQPLSATP